MDTTAGATRCLTSSPGSSAARRPWPSSSSDVGSARSSASSGAKRTGDSVERQLQELTAWSEARGWMPTDADGGSLRAAVYLREGRDDDGSGITRQQSLYEAEAPADRRARR